MLEGWLAAATHTAQHNIAQHAQHGTARHSTAQHPPMKMMDDWLAAATLNSARTSFSASPCHLQCSANNTAVAVLGEQRGRANCSGGGASSITRWRLLLQTLRLAACCRKPHHNPSHTCLLVSELAEMAKKSALAS